LITIRGLLEECKNTLVRSETPSETPGLDALILLERVTERDRGYLLAEQNEPVETVLDSDGVTQFRELLDRRRRGEPIAYIIGSREFFGLEFEVGPGVLIPRPDSEVLVERAISLLVDMADTVEMADTVDIAEAPPLKILDCCTGSGCIGISIAAGFAEVSDRPLDVVLSDIDGDALEWCRKNAAALKSFIGPSVSISITRNNLVGPVDEMALITANPPYLTDDETKKVLAKGWGEPSLALAAGIDGLGTIRKLVPQAYSSLRPGGYLVMEHGSTQGASVRELCKMAGFEPKSIRTGRDLADNERYVEARNGL